ncbi:sodium-coupled monocarboxylate transporter 1-like [Clavelina lepadiformis]|uniref:sodium-coupled monocarboxylate transporter 1-like n=1 Tax=Clavelina lepadiformis TaxID=159417 RepID=UPI00404213D5
MSYAANYDSGFSTADFVVFIGMLVVASLIGIFHAIKDRRTRSENIENYNYGGRSMSAIPLGLSMAVSYISALTMIGFPSEAYNYGAVVVWYAASPIVSGAIAYLYYIPLVHNLELYSMYEYLEYRFHVIVRKSSSALMILKSVLYMGMTVYLPALALNALTPLTLNWSIALTSGICTFYTCVGGIKAVVWTDTLQTVIMFVGGFAALVKTIVIVGGFGKMWNALERGGRMNIFDLSPDPTLQRTLWTVFLGFAIIKTNGVCCDQASGQRYLSCKSIKDARVAVIISVFVTIFITLVAVLTGCAAYAYYENCDPLKYGRITKKDQLAAVLILDVFSDIPGMTGLFVSAAFSGTLSSVSSGINSVSALILEDFVTPWKPHLSEKRKVIIAKLTGVFVGSLTTVMALVAQALGGTAISIVLTINGSLAGPVLGAFTLGLFFPWVNFKGVLTGQLMSAVFMIWMGVSSVIYGKPADKLRQLPTTTQGCPVNEMNYTTIDPYFNVTGLEQSISWDGSTTSLMNAVDTDEKPALYYSLWSLSFLYYGILGLILNIVISLAVSFATGANKPSDADPRYFMPFIDNPIFSEKVRRFFRFGVPEPSDHPEADEKIELSSPKRTKSLAKQFNSPLQDQWVSDKTDQNGEEDPIVSYSP